MMLKNGYNKNRAAIWLEYLLYVCVYVYLYVCICTHIIFFTSHRNMYINIPYLLGKKQRFNKLRN